ncbi:TPA: hypothetical protein QDB08_002690 [Burkholderia vietnamiensis]|uniref:Cap15 family cyclic dinucleotide receptor domain-containing protein n=1 Tax=Burkholderia vietnamiensis TaxID=60552 RepID=UPI001592C29D|nr:hypothetical protein [Burkholderia vietnamiensis]HDR9009720.1 hypothetical protein [Burkholderia vietnamiensis]HDR9013765.1 hypothetical protein [Burkholderia vietnamiensis]
MTDHEYSILNHDRGQIFQYIGTCITLIAAFYTARLGLIGHIVERFHPGASQVLPKTIDTAVAFSILYFVFNRWVWRNWVCRKVLHYHDVSGSWRVDGVTLGPKEALGANSAGPNWRGTIKINQQWTKIGVHLKTASSESFSKSAALQDVNGEALLMYSYGNQPSTGAHVNQGLSAHLGYCELRFSEDGKTAKGMYFNNLGRVTFGEMTLTKI